MGSAREFEGKKPVWLIDGDGSFQMTSEELAAAFLDHAPVKIAILNNSVYGMVRQWQTLFYEHHYSQTNLLDGEAHGADGAAALADGDAPLEVPDFIKLAEAYGCVGIRAFTEEEAIAAIEKANQINDRPVLIDFRVWKDAMVWPMVAAGAPNDEVTYKPGIKPLAGGTPVREPSGRACDRRVRARDRRCHCERTLRRGEHSWLTILHPSLVPSVIRCPCWWRTAQACWRVSPACSPAVRSTSTRCPSPPPSVRTSLASR